MSASSDRREKLEERLRREGCRMTRQRRILLDVILEGGCTSCKEIYYRAARIDPGIGFATVYRMVGKLEEIGVIDRKSMYRIREGETLKGCRIVLNDDTTVDLAPEEYRRVLRDGLRQRGHITGQSVVEVLPGK